MPYDLTKIAPFSIVFTWLFMGATVFTPVFSYLDASGLDFAAMDETRWLYVGLIVIASILFVVWIGAYILNGIWIYQAVGNARAMTSETAQVSTGKNARVSPGWAIGWHFVPFANLWMPCRAVLQTWNTSTDVGQDMSAPAKGPIRAWWACWDISWVALALSATLATLADTNDELQIIVYVDTVMAAFTIAAGYFFIQIVKAITEAQSNQTGVATIFE